MRVKDAPDLEAVLAELARLRERCDALEARLAAVEVHEPAATVEAAAEADAPPAAPADGEMREDTFGPAVKRTPSTGHFNAVNKALSMLGLVPVRMEESEEQRRAAAASHRRALDKAFETLGRAVAPAAPAAPAPAAEAPASDAAALEPPDEEVGRAFAPRWESEADVRRGDEPAVDLGEAVDIALEKTDQARDIAVPFLNGAVLVVAGAAALHAAGLIALPGQSQDGPWLETATGAVAVLLGALALTWRRASIHLRAIVGGTAVLLLNALFLMLVRTRAPLDPLPLLGVCGGVAVVGARVVLATRHPLSIFLGLTAALLLPYWLAPGDFRLWVGFALATNVAIGACALRMRRLQPSILAAAATATLFTFAPASLAAVAVGTCAALYLGQALAAPLVSKRAGNVASTLAVVAFGLLGFAVHGFGKHTGLAPTVALFLPATLAAFGAGMLNRRESLLRAVLKLGAVALVLSALPLGFSGPSLAAVTLVVGLLFGVFAYVAYDAYLRAAGALMLVVGAALTLAAGPTPLLWFGASACAALLYAVRAKGPDPAALRVLLVGLAHGTLLAGIALVTRPELVSYAWAALALAFAAFATQVDFTIVRAGAALAAGAAAAWALRAAPGDPLALGTTTLLLAPHAWLAGPARRLRTCGLFLLLFELMAVATALVSLAAPLGVLAVLPALGVLALPVWGRWTATLRAHARFLAMVLLARCLFPDFLAYAARPAWLNLRFAAMVAAVVPALVIARYARRGRVPATALGLSVVAAAVATEMGAWRYGLAALLPAGLLFGLLLARKATAAAEPEPETEPDAEPETQAESEPAPAEEAEAAEATEEAPEPAAP